MAAALAWQCVSSQALAYRWVDRLDFLSQDDRDLVADQLRALCRQLVRRQGPEFVPVLEGIVLEVDLKKRR